MKERRFAIRVAASVLFLASAFLFAVSVFGHNRLHDLDRARRDEPQFAIRTMDQLRAAARVPGWEGFSERRKMEELFRVVTLRFDHGSSLNSFSSNWILWAVGKIEGEDRSEIATVRDPGIVLRTQATVLCSEISFVLMQAALLEGIRARHVWLHGHVVMEAFYDGKWHMYDPDYSVYEDSGGEARSVEELEKSPALIREIYGKDAPAVEDIYTTVENNSVSESKFNAGSARASALKMFCEILKFLAPLIGMAAAVLLWRWDFSHG